MKKSALKERIAELERDAVLLRRSSVRELERAERWRKTAVDLHVELVKWMAAGRASTSIPPIPTTQHNEKDPDLFGQRVERVEGWIERLISPTKPDCDAAVERWGKDVAIGCPITPAEHVYREGICLGLTDEAARDRAAIGAEEWNRRRREEWMSDPGAIPNYRAEEAEILRAAQANAKKVYIISGDPNVPPREKDPDVDVAVAHKAMAPDYMRQITVPLPPKPAYEQDVDAAITKAAAEVAGVHEAMAPDDDFDKALAAANQKLKVELAGIGPNERRIMTSGEFKAR